ncbi:MAG: hypothetical protein QXT02_02305 [Candidatus Hadarchaeum sp.]
MIEDEGRIKLNVYLVLESSIKLGFLSLDGEYTHNWKRCRMGER